jgi:membrane fusion protein (multidrug efflux system)
MAATLDPTMHLQPEPGKIELAPERDVTATGEAHAVRHWPGPWWAGLVLAAAVLLGLGGRWWTYSRSHVTTDNAYVAGRVHQIGSRVAGTVIEVPVGDNERIAAGTPLFRLDPRDFELRVQHAQTQLTQAAAQASQAVAQLQQTKAQVAQAQAKSAKAAAELERARLDFERAQRLTENGHFAVISKQEFDSVKAAFEVAQAGASVAKADLESTSAFVAAAEAAHGVAEAQRASAQVNLADAELQLSYAVTASPVSGTLGRKNVEAGQRVQPGQALLAVVADEKWITANFKETQLARMRVGQRVTVRIDAMPGHVFVGEVNSFSPASGAQFALLPPDNATGNFTKIVQRVPVKIVFDPASIEGFEARIVPGLSALVVVNL